MKKTKNKLDFHFERKFIFSHIQHTKTEKIRIETRDKNIFGVTKTDINYFINKHNIIGQFTTNICEICEFCSKIYRHINAKIFKGAKKTWSTQ